VGRQTFLELTCWVRGTDLSMREQIRARPGQTDRDRTKVHARGRGIDKIGRFLFLSKSVRYVEQMCEPTTMLDTAPSPPHIRLQRDFSNKLDLIDP